MTALQSSGRADVFAEPELTYACRVSNCCRKDDHEHKKNNIFYVTEDLFKTELRYRYHSDKFLQKTEGTQITAHSPSQNDAESVKKYF